MQCTYLGWIWIETFTRCHIEVEAADQTYLILSQFVNTEAELKQQVNNWSGMARAAQNRVRWRGVADGLCSAGSDGHKYVSHNMLKPDQPIAALTLFRRKWSSIPGGSPAIEPDTLPLGHRGGIGATSCMVIYF